MQVTMFDILNEIDNEAFKEYHRKYPNVYRTFVRLTIATKNKGFKKFSARGIFQVMRWLNAGREKDDGFKYNNNYTPYYVRLFENEYPEHAGFFEKRKVKKPSLILKNV